MKWRWLLPVVGALAALAVSAADAAAATPLEELADDVADVVEVGEPIASTLTTTTTPLVEAAAAVAAPVAGAASEMTQPVIARVEAATAAAIEPVTDLVAPITEPVEAATRELARSVGTPLADPSIDVPRVAIPPLLDDAAMAPAPSAGPESTPAPVAWERTTSDAASNAAGTDRASVAAETPVEHPNAMNAPARHAVPTTPVETTSVVTLLDPANPLPVVATSALVLALVGALTSHLRLDVTWRGELALAPPVPPG